MQRFSDRYLKAFSGTNFYRVRYYLTFVLNYKDSLTEGEAALADIIKTVTAALKGFDCHVLQVVESVAPDGASTHYHCEHTAFFSLFCSTTTISLNRFLQTKSKSKSPTATGTLDMTCWKYATPTTKPPSLRPSLKLGAFLSPQSLGCGTSF
ncbi:hypothetical protein JCM19239_1464 [Vibrio variabilis]|uniref:Uncharacterized protein n=1 Tax=Vibrio variabilis TaxID=990271 RepID=A0ABQ0JG79_9VIBR|nr:hypothetical protein JCM19239_1464 [Vibrio variabilis]